MAYDEGLAQRTAEVLDELQPPNLVEKRMFGGVGYLVKGNMACGVHGDQLIVRVGPQRYEETLARSDTAPFDITGRPMKGWITVGPKVYGSREALRDWIRQGVQFALTLPPK
jgi:TfoX/Sxy family transcriptional regulator of competence genes